MGVSPQTLRQHDMLPMLDDRDRSILRLLQSDGRLSNADLAAQVNLSPSACHRRVHMLQDAGYIDRYVALLNANIFGFGGVAFVLVTLQEQGRAALDRFEAAVIKHPEILECYLLAGSADYLVRISYRDASDFERIHTGTLTRLPGVSRVQSTLALRTVKKTTEIPI
jgi:Lrp/AsnC family transcriptional regulator, leucine-responsive regulatory protein